MPDQYLHIISFDVPYPADYGGVIDVFHKVRSLHALGVKIHLHCFAYGRAIAPELEQYCVSVEYYRRNMNRTLLMHPMPFIMVSRQSDRLLQNLLKDDHPILFEGKHTCYYLDHPLLKERGRYVRTHNVESDYYASLASIERNPFKRSYLRAESKKLKRIQPRLSEASHLFCISEKDRTYFSDFNPSATTVPPFHAMDEARYTIDKEAYALYHGNLAVGENDEAAQYLVDEVFSTLAIPLRLFGKGPSKALKRKVASHSHITLQSGSQDVLEELVQKAQVNILPTFQATGMKLKLLYSLYNGGHVVVNGPMVMGTGVESVTHIASDARDFQSKLQELMPLAFTEVEFNKRKELLERHFSNSHQAQQIKSVVFD